MPGSTRRPTSDIPAAKPRNPNPDVLARIVDNPHLARVVPLLGPEVLHAVIARCGLQDSGDLLALATPEQLSAVFDLDLWKASRAGADEQFDAARFCEWLEVLVDTGAKSAAASIACIDTSLVVAGLSPNVKVFDPGVFSPVVELSGADPVMNAGGELGVHAEIGGFIVVSRDSDGWDTIVQALRALEEYEPDAFHRVMRTCRRLSDSGREMDGLDDLLSDARQASFDLSVSRELRHGQLGFLPAQDARAFLESSRRVSFTGSPPKHPPAFVAYQRSMETASTLDRRPRTSADKPAEDTQADAPAVAELIDVLRDARVLTDTPRALLPAAANAADQGNAAFNRYVELCADTDDRRMRMDQQLAFLANALMAGCSLQGRTFGRREAVDAVAATCNLALEHWPLPWRASVEHDVLTVFQAGWTRLHVDVLTKTANGVREVVDRLRFNDRDLQMESHALRRELNRALQAGTPWRVRDRLELLASLDLPAWAALCALLDECPVLLANVSASGDRPLHTVNPSEFRFISSAADVDAVHRFLHSLMDLLTR